MNQVRAYPKSAQLYSKRIKPTQRQMGNITQKVREVVKERSNGVCEVRMKCTGARAVDMAHITGRKQINRRTTPEDLLHSCKACHIWLDETVEGIRYKRRLRGD